MAASHVSPAKKDSLLRWSWFVLAYTIAVVLFGALVRATGSGAGCGSHWPLCNGVVLPPSPGMETIIEYTHRITSGVAMLLVAFLLWRILRGTHAGAPARKAAWWTAGLMGLEALIGAGLVLFEMVAYNVSIARAYWMGAHLINTFLLLGALTLTVWFVGGGSTFKVWGKDPFGVLFIATLLGWFILGISGGVAALGDTLTLGGGLSPETEPVVATLTSLRILHPLLAVIVSALLLAVSYLGITRQEGEPIRKLGAALAVLVLIQLLVGLVNVWLLAPVWLQLVHLLFTNLIWIVLVWFGATVLSTNRSVLGPASAFWPV